MICSFTLGMFHSCVLHLPCKLFHFFADIEKSPLINNEITNYMCTEKKIIICTIWII